MSSIENKFFIVKDTFENEIILFSFQSAIHILKCIKLKNTTITFTEKPIDDNYCDANLGLEFHFVDKKFKGYLEDNNIIRPYYDQPCLIPCENSFKDTRLFNSSKIIRKNGSKISIFIDNERINTKPLNLYNVDNSKINFKHSKEILNGFDFEREFKSIYNQVDKQSIAKLDVLNDPNFKKSTSLLSLSLFKNLFFYLKLFLIVFLLLFFTLLIIVVVKYFNIIRNFLTPFLNRINCRNIRKFVRDLKMKNTENNKSDIELKIFNKPTTSLNAETIIPTNSMENICTEKETDLSLKNSTSQTDSLIMNEFKSKISKYNQNDSFSIQPSKLYKIDPYKTISTHHYLNDSITLFKDDPEKLNPSSSNVDKSIDSYNTSLHYSKGKSKGSNF
jgi:hypothetical protein